VTRAAGAGRVHPARRAAAPRLAADRHDADPVAGGSSTRDNVSVDVFAVPAYRVAHPIRSVVAIENRVGGDQSDRADHAARRGGRHRLDETLSETDTINQNIREILDVQTEEWGVQVTIVELTDIQLPETMKRAMARQAEAEREKRAKIIAAQGEAQAAGEPAAASDLMMAHPAGAAAAQPPDAGRDLGREELLRRLPGAADEHDPRARRVARSRVLSGSPRCLPRPRP
jgi:regulator of protease activity HflC (stomatin/prohibitin superfamily)